VTEENKTNNDMFFSQQPLEVEKKVAPEPKKFLTEEEVSEFVERIKGLDKNLPDKLAFDIDSLGPWSFSKMKSLKKCPFQFYLQYILKFKLPEHYQTQSDPLAANRGKAAHEILEFIMLGDTVENSYSRAKVNYVGGKILTEEEWINGVDTLNYNITKFAERIESLSRRHTVKKSLTELRMGFTRDYKPASFFGDNVWIRGVIDLVLLLECNDIIIIDHKTGGGQGGASTRNYESQLNFYKVLYHFGVHNIAGAQSGIHFIEAGEIPMADYHDAQQIEKDLVLQLEWALQGAVDSCKEKGFFKHVRGGYCKWCQYDGIGCKSGELKPLELSTKRFFKIEKV
jgi:ATP-dependent exoDNAse (exonuclease V) beta subunit